MSIGEVSDTSPDLLQDASWTCVGTPAGSVADPDALRAVSGWVPARVPGTAASAQVAAGFAYALRRDYDNTDWWFRCEFEAPAEPPPSVLDVGGLATVCDVWLNGRHLLHSENMFVSHRVDVDELETTNVLLVRCSAINPLISGRLPRPRWRTPRLANQNLRWYRTTLLGRVVGWPPTPAPVGIWRPLRLLPRATCHVRHERLVVTYDHARATGQVDLHCRVTGAPFGAAMAVEIGDTRFSPTITDSDGDVVVSLAAELEDVNAWWPRTHGEQPLYDVVVVVGEERHLVRRVGFRSIEVDRSDGGFTFVVNGVPIFARGTNWSPPDPVNLAVDPDVTRALVDLMVEGNFNIVRVSGSFVYESDHFLDLLDELGLLLWQDAMFAYVDVPDDEAFIDSCRIELEQVFTSLQGRPSLAVVCGGGDTEEQALFMGVPFDELHSHLARDVIPRLVEERLPETCYVRTTPGESPMPTAVGQGLAHYYGVGAYLKPLSDVRAAGVRFAVECLPIATPPEPMPPVHEARLRRGWGHRFFPREGGHRDPGAFHDLEDVRDVYTEGLFDVRVTDLRRRDPERAVELFRATSAEIFSRVLSEWRRPGSPCAGVMPFHFVDLRHGQDLGMVDLIGRPKASWYVMRRLMKPVALLLTDEGLSGLGVHIVNDSARPLSAQVRVDLYLDGVTLLESASIPVQLSERDAETIDVSTIFGSFRDLSYAYRFGRPAADVVAVTLSDDAGWELDTSIYLPGGCARPQQRDVGISAALEQCDEGWAATLTTKEFAHWVSFDVPNWRPSDSWFHLLPDRPVRVILTPEDAATGLPRGYVTALNSVTRCPLTAREL